MQNLQYGVMMVGGVTFFDGIAQCSFWISTEWYRVLRLVFFSVAICRKIPRDLIDGGITIWSWIIHFCSTSNVVFVWNGQFSISKSATLYFLSG